MENGAVKTGPVRMGLVGAEERDERHAEGVGEVHAAGIVGHEQTAPSELIGKRRQVGFAGKVFDAVRRKAGGDGGRDRTVVGRAEHHEARLRKQFNEGAPTGDRPAFLGANFPSRESDRSANPGFRRAGAAANDRLARRGQSAGGSLSRDRAGGAPVRRSRPGVRRHARAAGEGVRRGQCRNAGGSRSATPRDLRAPSW